MARRAHAAAAAEQPAAGASIGRVAHRHAIPLRAERPPRLAQVHGVHAHARGQSVEQCAARAQPCRRCRAGFPRRRPRVPGSAPPSAWRSRPCRSRGRPSARAAWARRSPPAAPSRCRSERRRRVGSAACRQPAGRRAALRAAASAPPVRGPFCAGQPQGEEAFAGGKWFSAQPPRSAGFAVLLRRAAAGRGSLRRRGNGFPRNRRAPPVRGPLAPGSRKGGEAFAGGKWFFRATAELRRCAASARWISRMPPACRSSSRSPGSSQRSAGSRSSCAGQPQGREAFAGGKWFSAQPPRSASGR